MRRIIAVLVVLFILCGLVAAGVVYHLRNTGKRLRWQVQIALNQGNSKAAIVHAERYLERNPNDPTAWMLVGRAYLQAGRYDNAREQFQRIRESDATDAPARRKAAMYLADSYAYPARETINDMRDVADLEAKLNRAIAELETANELLSTLSPDERNERLEIRRSMAYNLLNLRNANWRLASWYNNQSELSDKANKPDQARAQRERATGKLAEKDRLHRQTVEAFLDYVREDPAREDTAMALIGVAMRAGDDVTLDKVERLVLDQEKPPAAPALEMILHRIRREMAGQSPDKRGEVLADGMTRLEALLEKHPDNVDLLVRLGETSLNLGKIEKAETHAARVARLNPEFPEGRYLAARLHMVRREFAVAEKILQELSVRDPRNARYMFEYARAALAAGHVETARGKMREIVDKIDPDHRAAREYLTRFLLSVGQTTAAVRDARKLYELYLRDPQHGDPQAVRLYVEALLKDRRTADAVKTLDQAVARSPEDTGLLAVAAESYRTMGDEEKFREYAERVRKSTPKDKAERLARARILYLTGHDEAMRILQDEEARSPDDARVVFELGRLLDMRRSKMQAIEKYRRAVELDPYNTNYRMVLAQALFDVDDIEGCREVLAKVDDDLVAKKMLLLQIGLGQGDTPEDIENLKLQGGSRLAVAMAYLTGGNPAECVRICLEELQGNATDHNTRTLLGMAYAAQRKSDEALEQFRMVLQAQSWNQNLYRRIATVLTDRKNMVPGEVRATMLKYDGAQQGAVDMTMGWLYERLGDMAAGGNNADKAQDHYANSAQAYANVMSWGLATDEMKDRARLLRAQSLAKAGKADEAVAELDVLAGRDGWANRIHLAKADILLRADKKDRALKELDALLAGSTTDADTRLLHAAADLLNRVGDLDRLAGIVDRIKALRPGDAATWLQAAVLAQHRDKMDEAVEAYRKAIDAQPSNFQTYVVLAGLLNNLHRPAEALAVLDEMGKVGEAGLTESLFKKGQLYERLGLKAKAVECYEELGKLGFADNPNLKFALGQALTFLDEKEKARAVMGQIPKTSKMYLRARQYMVEMASTPEGKIAEVEKLRQEFPKDPGLVAQKMALLTANDKFDEALDTLSRFRTENPQLRLPPTFQEMAFQVAVRKSDETLAARMAADVAGGFDNPVWRRRAVLLNPAVSGLAVQQQKLIVKPDMVDALVFLSAFGKQKNAEWTGYWHGKLVEIDTELRKQNADMGVPANLLMLADIVAGVPPKEALKRVEGAPEAVVADARRLVEIGSAGMPMPELATEMIRSTMAGHDQLATMPFGQQWAFDLLKARPECPWTAKLAVRGQSDPELLRKVLDVMKPRDSLLAVQVEAALMASNKKFEEAARLYGKAVSMTGPDNVDDMMKQATSLEQAGKRQEALQVYDAVLGLAPDKVGRNRFLVATNNAAYLVAELYPQNKPRLDKAFSWITTAMSDGTVRVPGEFVDTHGWISYLLGNKEEALKNLRMAVKMKPDSFEIQHHIGVVEKEVGDRDLALLHLRSARNLGTQMLKDKNVSSNVVEKLESIGRDIADLEKR